MKSNKNNNSSKKNIKRDTHLNEKDLYKNIGILDPEGIENNPLTGEPYENLYYNSNKNINKTNFTYKSAG